MSRILIVSALLATSVFPCRCLAQADQDNYLESLLADAKQAQARSDFGAAAAAYRQAVKLDSTVPELWANLGLMDYRIREFGEASTSFREAIRLKPSLFAPHLFLGLSYVETNQMNLAIPPLQKAEFLNPMDPQPLLALGHVYSSLKQVHLALREFRHAAEIDPASVPAWFGLGVSYMEEGESDARRLSVANPKSSYSLSLFAESLASQKKYTQAVNEFRQAIGSPDAPSCTRASLGLVYLKQGQLTEARNEFRAESDADPGCGLHAIGIARLEIEAGSDAAGIKTLSDLWFRDSGFTHENLSLLLDGLSQQQSMSLHASLVDAQASGSVSKELAEELDNDLIVAPVLPAETGTTAKPRLDARAQEAQDSHDAPATLLAQGRYGACTSRLKRELRTASAEKLRLLATCSFFTGDFETTVLASRQLLDRSPNDPAALYWSIKSSQKLAVRALARVGEIDPNSFQNHVLLGDVYRRRAHYDQAKEEYQKALSLAPQTPAALLGLTATHLMTAQVEDAISTGQQLLQQDPSNPEANLLLAEAYVAHHDYGRAQPLLERSRTVRPELQGRVHILLGTIYAEDGRNTEALAELKQGARNDEDGSVYYKLARVYKKLGDDAAANAAFEAAKKLAQDRLTRATVAVQDSSAHSADQQ